MDTTTPVPSQHHNACLYHYEIAPNFTQVCENLRDWIKKNNVLREQIISISAHETAITNGDSVLVLLFKKDQDPSMGSLETLNFHLLKNLNDWHIHFDEHSHFASN